MHGTDFHVAHVRVREIKGCFHKARFPEIWFSVNFQPRCSVASAPRKSSSDSWLLFCGQFLKTRIFPDLIPDRIESQQRWSNRKDIRYPQQPLENGNGM